MESRARPALIFDFIRNMEVLPIAVATMRLETARCRSLRRSANGASSLAMQGTSGVEGRSARLIGLFVARGRRRMLRQRPDEHNPPSGRQEAVRSRSRAKDGDVRPSGLTQETQVAVSVARRRRPARAVDGRFVGLRTHLVGRMRIARDRRRLQGQRQSEQEPSEKVSPHSTGSLNRKARRRSSNRPKSEVIFQRNRPALL